MAKTIATTLVAASILLGGGLTAAFAAAAPCSEQPNADACPTFGSPTKSEQAPPPHPMRHAHNHRAPEAIQRS